MAKAKDINLMVDKLEAELTALAKSVHADLTKAHPGEETTSEMPPDESATAPGGPPPDASMGAPPGGDPGGDPGGPPEGGPPGEDPGGPPGEEGGGAPTHEQIVEALSQLPPEQLEMYKAAIDQVLAQQQGGDPGAGGAPPEASMGGPPPGGAPMGMSEDGVIAKAEYAIAEQGVQIRTLRKALEDATAEIKSVKAERQEAVQTIETFLKRPDRRAVTSSATSDVKKSEEDISSLSKAEIVSRLRQSLRTPRTKADYKAVDGFMFHGQPVETVKYLITGANA